MADPAASISPMTPPPDARPEQIDTSSAILIVVGAHLRAEVTDRPLAYRLRERLLAWLDAEHASSPDAAPEVIVCTDLWYLNADELRSRPTISVGPPGVNALTAYLADKVPSAFAIDNVLSVQLDTDFLDLTACCWGNEQSATASAIDAFCERYLDRFMERID